MLETATRKRGLLDTRIKDSVQMMELVVKSFREKGDDASPSKSDPFIWRDKERRYRELLEDCQRLITSFQRELNSLPDPSNLRGDSASRILERLRGMVGEGRELNGREVLLLCERLVKSESVVMQLRDREGCLAEELMAAEKKKEEVEKRLKEALMRIPSSVPLPSNVPFPSSTAPFSSPVPLASSQPTSSTMPLASNPVVSSTIPLASTDHFAPTIPPSSTMPSSSHPMSDTTPLANPSTAFPLASARYGLTPLESVTPVHPHSRSEIDDIIRSVREKVNRLK